uniref:Uncharacterized protein n=1 Tax=Solanum tuberosum TaxID=4113 RepID=M1DGM8_SOLTU
MESTTGRDTPRGLHLAKEKYTGEGHDGLHGPWFIRRIVNPFVTHSSTLIHRFKSPNDVHEGLHGPWYYGSSMKECSSPSTATALQSEGDHTQESSSSEVQINVTPEDHPSRATRSSTMMTILQITPSQSDEEGRSSESGEEEGCQSDNGSGGSSESASGSSEMQPHLHLQ